MNCENNPKRKLVEYEFFERTIYSPLALPFAKDRSDNGQQIARGYYRFDLVPLSFDYIVAKLVY